MSIQLVITSQEAGLAVPLQVEVSGYRLELSGITPGMKLAVGEDGGRITVRLDAAEVEAVQPAAELPVVEAQPEAAAVVEPEAAQTDETAGAVVELPDGQASEVHEPAEAEQTEQLFQQLVTLRKKIAAEVRLPPYIIFHDRTLKEMCRLLPADSQALGLIQGVGAAKLEKYGRRFLEAIRYYKAAGKAA